MDMIITSAAFAHNDSIPKLYTCEGSDISPPLTWRGVPAGAKSLVLFMLLGAALPLIPYVSAQLLKEAMSVMHALVKGG